LFPWGLGDAGDTRQGFAKFQPKKNKSTIAVFRIKERRVEWSARVLVSWLGKLSRALDISLATEGVEEHIRG